MVLTPFFFYLVLWLTNESMDGARAFGCVCVRLSLCSSLCVLCKGACERDRIRHSVDISI